MIVETLIAHGADVKAVNENNGTTPLHVAAERGHTDIVDALLAKGADAKAARGDGTTRSTMRREWPQRDRRRAAHGGRRRDGKEQVWQIAGRPRQGSTSTR